MLRRLIESEGRWIHALLVLSTLTVALILTDLVARYVTYFSDVLVMLIVAWLFAFILSPLVGIIQRVVPKLPRTVAVVLVYGSLFVVLSAIVLLVASQLAGSVTDFIKQYPDLKAKLPATLHPWEDTLSRLGFGQIDLVTPVQQALQNLNDIGGNLVGPLTSLAITSLGVIGNLLLVVFLSLFVVLDKDNILAFINRVAPPRYADEMRLFETSVASSFGGFLRGQAIQGVIFGAFALVGSVIFGIPFAPATTAMVAVLQMIPFFGPFFSWAPPVAAAALTGNPVLPIFMVMAVGWFITMNIVQPRVMSQSVGIHPVMVLIAVLIGLKLQGWIGAIFAIPVAAVISTFFFYYLDRSVGGPRDVASRAARRLEEREGRPYRVPTAPGTPASPSSKGASRRRAPAASEMVDATYDPAADDDRPDVTSSAEARA